MKCIQFASLLLVGVLVLTQPADAWQPAASTCPYLDGPARPFYSIAMGLTSDARTGDRGPRYSQLELRSEADLGYFHNVWQGDIDLGVRFDHVVPLRQSAFDPPSHLMALAVEVRWFWRYINGTALELQFDPGFYSSTQDVLDMPLAMPIRVSGIYTIDPTLALVGGLQVRPTFNYLYVPHGGVVWQPYPQFRLDATVPDARMTVHLDREWSGYAGWMWESTTYHIRALETGHNRMTLTNQEVYLGISRGLHDELRVSGTLGWMMDRHVRATRSRSGARQTLDIDDALVLRVGVSGAF